MSHPEKTTHLISAAEISNAYAPFGQAKEDLLASRCRTFGKYLEVFVEYGDGPELEAAERAMTEPTNGYYAATFEEEEAARAAWIAFMENRSAILTEAHAESAARELSTPSTPEQA